VLFKNRCRICRSDFDPFRAAPKKVLRPTVLSSDTREEFCRREQELSALYQKRNSVVHGGAKRGGETWYTEVATASEEASRTALFQYLFAIARIWAVRGANDRKKLHGWLAGLDNVAGRYRKQSS
jgi:hypothetical protein